MTTLTPARPLPWRLLGWGTALALLLAPLLAMQVSREVAWTPFDFAAAAALLGGTGLALELLLPRLRDRRARLTAALLVLAALVLVWLELAVGLFD